MNMQRTIIIVLAAVVVAGGSYFLTRNAGGPAAAGNAAITWSDFTAGYGAAQASNKKMVIDVYTDWCTWCKTMDKETYANPDVAKYVQEHFVAVKLNAESTTMRQIKTMQMSDAELATAFGVSGYPTTVFVASDGSPITSMDGYIKAGEFKTVLQYIAEDKYKTMSYEQFKSQVH